MLSFELADRDMESVEAVFRRAITPDTSWQNQNIYNNPPSICGKNWQLKYQRLHENILSGRAEPRFLVYSCPLKNGGCCGYGNRVYALVSLFYLAVLTDRAFLIDWQAPKPLELLLEPKGIKWNFPIPQLETRKHYWRTGGEEVKIRDGWLTKKTGKFLTWMRRKNVVRYFDKPVEVATTIVFFAQYSMQKNKFLIKRAKELDIPPLLPGAPRYSMIGCAYDYLFRPKTSLQNAINNTKKFLRENDNFVIGIHIRTGDQQFGRNNTRVSNFQKFFSCAIEVESKILHPMKHTKNGQTLWFLATDSPEVKDYARKYFPEKVITGENKPEHFDIYKEGEKPSVEGMMAVLHDHFILAESDFLVLSESSFSKTAVGLSMRRRDSYTFGDRCDLKLKN